MTAAAKQTCTSEQGIAFDPETIRSFILAALAHPAAAEQTDNLLYSHVAEGRCHPTVVAASLRPIIDDIIQTATAEDWDAITRQLTTEAREALGIEAPQRSAA